MKTFVFQDGRIKNIADGCETGRKERYEMEQTEKINKLFENTKILMQQYEQDRKKQGMDFNVFEILDIKEVMTCRILHALLDPKGAHGCGVFGLEEILANHV